MDAMLSNLNLMADLRHGGSALEPHLDGKLHCWAERSLYET
jgi:hypothetical protein